jgi:hypothetical protein
MARSAQQVAFEKVFDFAVRDLQPPEFQRQLAAFARRTLAEHLAHRPDKPSVATRVDGVLGAAEESVRFGGVIRYEFGSGAKVVEETLKWLISEGAKVGQKYAQSFFVGVLKSTVQKAKAGRGGKREWDSFEAEGRMIPAQNFAASSRALPPDASYIIGNSQPFNRKVDVQLVGTDPVNFSIPDMIYDRAAMAMGGRFPGFSVRRVYTMTFSGQYVLQTGRRAGLPVHSPGLIIGRI